MSTCRFKHCLVRRPRPHIGQVSLEPENTFYKNQDVEMSKKKTPVFTEDTTQRPSLLIASIPYDIILFKGFLNKTEQPKSLFKINILNPKNQIITFCLVWVGRNYFLQFCLRTCKSLSYFCPNRLSQMEQGYGLRPRCTVSMCLFRCLESM